jgi:ligand-binding SRPBCC domain-containing protein
VTQIRSASFAATLNSSHAIHAANNRSPLFFPTVAFLAGRGRLRVFRAAGKSSPHPASLAKGAHRRSLFVAPPPRPPSDPPLRSFAAGAGTYLTVSFRPVPYSPIRMSWRVRIAEFEWNDHFCDVQEDGPFAAWKHCHHTRPESRDGVAGTLTEDSIEYSLPLGALGKIANAVVIERMLRYTFAYRHQATVVGLDRIAAKYRTSPATP